MARNGFPAVFHVLSIRVGHCMDLARSSASTAGDLARCVRTWRFNPRLGALCPDSRALTRDLAPCVKTREL
ncbi:hypothetical protein CBR_g46292 [Chara braunii]|uniref:Uncharacterized protein n=1 Tax=Chara braunii TaxID=69332 RepID=A0A388M024_CHABU|nr:hypothetical protein CBR_g46292 [Chara braunii]|eukprot:GBG87924.1 hypothetical protein CBR_g46292 [Chara braunii]